MQIGVQNLQGLKYYFECEGSDTFYALKEKLSIKTGIPVLELVLLRNGEPFKDSMTLSECGVGALDGILWVSPKKQEAKVASVASSSSDEPQYASSGASSSSSPSTFFQPAPVASEESPIYPQQSTPEF